MNTCAYCQKELPRKMFCNHSHQVMFHKRGRPKILNLRKLTEKIEEKGIELCKHGAMIGLCKQGCRK